MGAAPSRTGPQARRAGRRARARLRRSAEEHSIPHERLAPSELERRFPIQLRAGDGGGAGGREGVLDPEACVSAHLEMARAKGARSASASRGWLEREADGVQVLTSGGRIHGDRWCWRWGRGCRGWCRSCPCRWSGRRCTGSVRGSTGGVLPRPVPRLPLGDGTRRDLLRVPRPRRRGQGRAPPWRGDRPLAELEEVILEADVEQVRRFLRATCPARTASGSAAPSAATPTPPPPLPGGPPPRPRARAAGEPLLGPRLQVRSRDRGARWRSRCTEGPPPHGPALRGPRPRERRTERRVGRCGRNETPLRVAGQPGGASLRRRYGGRCGGDRLSHRRFSPVAHGGEHLGVLRYSARSASTSASKRSRKRR